MEINFDVHGAINNDQVWILVYLFASNMQIIEIIAIFFIIVMIDIKII